MNAIQTEFNSLIKNQTLELVDLPDEKNIVSDGTNWLQLSYSSDQTPSKVVSPPGKLVESPEYAFRMFFEDY